MALFLFALDVARLEFSRHGLPTLRADAIRGLT